MHRGWRQANALRSPQVLQLDALLGPPTAARVKQDGAD